MNKTEVTKGIHKSWSFVEELCIGMTFSNPSPMKVEEEYRNLVLSENPKYEDIYLCGIRLSHYNFMLYDYSFFQFSCSDDYEVAYSYSPNPFGDSFERMEEWRQLLEQGIILEPEFDQLMESSQVSINQPPIRYENSRSQYRGLEHPCSHLHIGFHRENRWAISRVLTPEAFTMFILKQYYPTEWSGFGYSEESEFGNNFEERLSIERRDCRIIGDDFFSDREKETFHFS
ncbi:MAG: DUF2290 domain-containing protein [Alphaproteobacteria bacterium]|nr:DUF2290 domain-containing protein [Alphaproteobacteria bacterium]MBO6863722.1 DUF2290 domain-containing protein [Alphaproteobacteria bacterium]